MVDLTMFESSRVGLRHPRFGRFRRAEAVVPRNGTELDRLKAVLHHLRDRWAQKRHV